MKVDNPQAFAFIMQDEIYLLPKDKPAKPAILTTPEEQVLPENIPVDTVPSSAQIIHAVEEESNIEPVKQVIATPEILQPVVETNNQPFNYLGDNNKSFLIMVNYSNEEHIAPDHLKAIESILKRKDLELSDVAILNVSKYAPVKLTELAAFFKPARLVIMGANSLPDGIGNLPLNQPVKGKKTHVLYSFSFDEMMSSNDNKKTFWEHMKTL